MARGFDVAIREYRSVTYCILYSKYTLFGKLYRTNICIHSSSTMARCSTAATIKEGSDAQMSPDYNNPLSPMRRTKRPTRCCSSLWITTTILLFPTACHSWTTSSTASCRSPLRRSTSSVLALADINDINDNEEDDAVNLDPPQELQQSLGSLFQLQRKAPINEDPAGGFSLTDVQDYFTQREPGTPSPASIPSLNTLFFNETLSMDNNTQSEGLYLDPDLYLKSKEFTNPDGSLNLPDTGEQSSALNDYQRIIKAVVRPAPNSPDAVLLSKNGNGNAANPSVEELWDTIQQTRQQQAAAPNTAAAAEELHQQVFAQEQGYLQQSELFRESLTDSSKVDEAKAQRHGEQFRQRQAQALAELEQQLQEWQDVQLANQTDSDTRQDQRQPKIRCSKCQCILSKEEIPKAAKHKGLCQVCFGEMLAAKSKFDDSPRNNNDSNDGTKPRLRSRPSSRTVLTRPRTATPAAPSSKDQSPPTRNVSKQPSVPSTVPPRKSPPSATPLSATASNPRSLSQAGRPQVRPDEESTSSPPKRRPPTRAAPPSSFRPKKTRKEGELPVRPVVSQPNPSKAGTVRPPRNWPHRPLGPTTQSARKGPDPSTTRQPQPTRQPSDSDSEQDDYDG